MENDNPCCNGDLLQSYSPQSPRPLLIDPPPSDLNVVYNTSIKGCGMCCPVCRKVHIKDALLVIGKSSLCDDSGFPLKKYATMIIWLMSNSQ